MNLNIAFMSHSILLGIALAMDAFSVSLANGLNEPKMNTGKMCRISGVYAFFQAAMPMTGWLCIRTIAGYFKIFEKMIPWIALLLLIYIGSGMILDALKKEEDEDNIKHCNLCFKSLVIQGIATSIDALSVGFTISDYNVIKAFACVLIIALVTFIICFIGLIIGKKFGIWLADKACILGGLILILIGIEIFVTGIFIQ